MQPNNMRQPNTMQGPYSAQYGAPPPTQNAPVYSAYGNNNYNDKPPSNNDVAQNGNPPGYPMYPEASPPVYTPQATTYNSAQMYNPGARPDGYQNTQFSAGQRYYNPYSTPNNTAPMPSSMHSNPVSTMNPNMYSQQNNASMGLSDSNTIGGSIDQYDMMQFNAQSHYISSSVTKLPNTQSLRLKSHIPLGLCIHPLAATPIGQPEISTVNFGSGVVVRCKRCRTYINPFVQWDANGRKWICNLCTFVNETPQFYIRSLDDRGKREDRFERAELSMGSVEFVAPADYMIRPPQPPAYMIVLDVSPPAVTSGLLASACEELIYSIENDLFPGLERTMIGIITYDTSVHFYALKPQQVTPQVFIVAQINDMFLPLSDDLFVNLSECKASIIATLKSIPTMWCVNGFSENCMGSALKAAYLTIKHIGGKILLFSSAPPTIGEMVIKREVAKDKSAQNTDREAELFKPANDQYQQFGQLLTQSQVSVDMFLCPTIPSQGNGDSNYQNQNDAQRNAMPAAGVSFYDVASFATLAQYTSGELRFYPGFSRHEHGEKIQSEIRRNITRSTGWEAVMRIRVSRGWKIAQRYGRFFLRGTDLFVLPTINEDQVFYITLEPEEGVTPTPGENSNCVMLQVALLYTNSNGERRIRVHTYSLPLSPNLQEIAATIDPQVIAGLILQNATELSVKSKISDGRNYLQNVCSQLFSSLSIPQTTTGMYGAANQPQNTNSTEQLRTLSLYVLGLLKSVAFRSTKVPSDARVYQWHRLSSIPLSQLIAFCCPHIYCLSDMSNTLGGTLDGNEQIILPSPIVASSESMTQDGVYIVENGETLMIWIGKAVSSQWLNNVFGVPGLEYLHPDSAALSIGRTGDPIGTRILSIIRELQRQRYQPDFMHLAIVRQGDLNEQLFFSMLIHDRVQSLPLTYAEFLQKVGQRQLTPVAPRAY